MTANAELAALTDAGVSVWLDDLDRHRITSGGLADLIAHRSVRGVTTNPTIFDKAISSGGDAYAAQIAELAAAGADVDGVIRVLTTDDVRAACDLFTPLWVESGGEDGRVSIEVDPRLAHDTAGTIAQAVELWATVDRPNALIKIPATPEGLPAITEVIGRGISVNVTLIFSVDRYRAVIDAYCSGVEAALAAGRDVSTIRSVASFFVSRIDTEVDGRLKALGSPEAVSLLGRGAVANARLAWAAHLDALASTRWTDLAARGATIQRPLWASTGVKDPSYDPTMYVLDLVAPGCVNTMPEATLDAVAASETAPTDSVSGTEAESAAVWEEIAAQGIDPADVFRTLESEGVQKFIDSWEQLRASVGTAMGHGA